MFDVSKRVEIRGTVRQFQWKNPRIQLIAKDKAGKDVEWSLETGAPIYLYNNGLRPLTLKPGQVITITMSPLANGAHGGLVWSVPTPDGRKWGATQQ